MPLFHDITEIVFEEFTEGHESCRHRFSIRSPDEVEHLVSLARPKCWTGGVPMCRHFLRATFKNPADSTVVDFCPICFGSRPMPAEFYTEYLRLSRRHKRRIALVYCVGALILAVFIIAIYAKVRT